MTSLRPSALRDLLRGSWRILLKEIAAFGVVGTIAFVIDISVFNAFEQGVFHDSWVKSKAVSTVVSTTFAYFGNRQFSFSHRARTSIGRETAFFFGINLITLVFSELVIALFAYPLGQRHDHVVMNVVNIASIGIGTLFRFWAYKRFVFLHPDRVHRSDVDLDEELAE